MEDNYNLDKLRKKKTKRVNSQKKGGNFTLKITKIFNERFGTKEFSKTPTSGAYATTHQLPEHLKIYGDMISPKGFKFCVENKCGYDKENLGGFFKDNSDLQGFIQQSKIDADKSKLKFLVIFKQSRTDILCILDSMPELESFLLSRSSMFIKVSNKYICCKLQDLLEMEDSFFFE